jgi:hypothetical protein
MAQVPHHFIPVLFLGHDGGADLGMRSEAAEESGEVDPGRGHEDWALRVSQ